MEAVNEIVYFCSCNTGYRAEDGACVEEDENQMVYLKMLINENTLHGASEFIDGGVRNIQIKKRPADNPPMIYRNRGIYFDSTTNQYLTVLSDT